MLERREVLGGACVTEEVWPGFKVSTAAYVNSLLRPGDHPRPRAQAARVRDAAAQPVVVHAVPRRPLAAAGPGQGDDAPGDLQVQREGCRGTAALRGDARAGGRLPRADARDDAAEPVVAPARQPAAARQARARVREAGHRRAEGGGDPHRGRDADSRPLVRDRSSSRSRSRPTRSSARWPRPRCRGRPTCCSTT